MFFISLQGLVDLEHKEAGEEKQKNKLVSYVKFNLCSVLLKRAHVQINSL